MTPNKYTKGLSENKSYTTPSWMRIGSDAVPVVHVASVFSDPATLQSTKVSSSKSANMLSIPGDTKLWMFRLMCVVAAGAKLKDGRDPGVKDSCRLLP